MHQGKDNDKKHNIERCDEDGAGLLHVGACDPAHGTRSEQESQGCGLPWKTIGTSAATGKRSW